MAGCTLCPRRCGADRQQYIGICGADDRIKIARAAPHFWEEPCISGQNGSGAVFFSGCTLRCVYCQNYEISSGGKGEFVSREEFVSILFSLKEQGVHNINLVTPDQFLAIVAPILKDIKQELSLPIVINCSGYESREMLALLDGVADIYLVDYKYADDALAGRLSGVSDYVKTVTEALPVMFSQVGRPVFSEDGMLERGIILRHLVLPGERKNSLAVLDSVNAIFSADDFLLSLMSQYTPNGKEGAPSRTLTRFEYGSVAARAEEYGFQGYFQAFSSQNQAFTPPFDGKGVTK